MTTQFNTNELEASLISDPSTSYWLREQLNVTENRDLNDALNDAEMLVEVLKERLRQIHKEHGIPGVDEVQATLPNPKHMTIAIKYDAGAELPSKLSEAFAEQKKYEGLEITALSLENEFVRLEELEEKEHLFAQ